MLYTHPKVLEACSIGISDPIGGEAVKVFVVIKHGEIMVAEEVTDYCRARLPHTRFLRSWNLSGKYPGLR